VTNVAAVASYLEGRWQVGDGGQELRHAVTGDLIATASSGGLDLATAVQYGRNVGGPALRELTFHQRASMIRALGKALLADTEPLYTLSTATGATRADSWIDIEGGIGALMAYAGMARRQLPNSTVWVDGAVESLSRDGSFVGGHILTPRRGVAVQINAFNFPCWGMLEKLAPALLAGVPTIVKPATITSFLTGALVRQIIDSGLLPPGSLQLVCGRARGLLDQLDEQDSVSFTGSASTAQSLKCHPGIVDRSVRFSAEADSLNAAILGLQSDPSTPEFDLFIEEVASEMTAKAGQKCTAIRRILVPQRHMRAVEEALAARLARVRVGDPADAATEMGTLVGVGQREEVRDAISKLAASSRVVFDSGEFHDVDPNRAAVIAPTLMRTDDPANAAAHDVEAFGPVATLMAYQDLDDAVMLVARGRGSLVASVVTPDPAEAAALTLRIAAHHGRVHCLDSISASASTGHGSPLPQLLHGGPGRAGGSEELGGVRAVAHYMQRTAVQGSPDVLTAVTGTWVAGAARRDHGHPFKLHFDELQIGDSLETERRIITVEDIERFADLTGDHFYAHMDDVAAKASPIFDGRVAHGYFVVAAAAGLFVWPDPGPVLANYGLDNLRFATPTYPGAELRVQLTCKEKSMREGAGYGEVRWDTQVLNQDDDVVAAYDVLTMVATSGSSS